MTKNVNIELSDEKFEELKKYKEERGLSWRGVLKQGITFFAPPPEDSDWELRYKAEEAEESE